VQAGADVKSVRAQVRHARSSTTLDIYAQTVNTTQRQAIEKLTEFAKPIGTSFVSLSHSCPSHWVN
jgi:hypothetical protein